MRGHVIVQHLLDTAWIYVPAAKIKFRAIPGGTYGLHVIAFRTDGRSVMPMDEWLRENHLFGPEIDVPEDVVHFALETARRAEAASQREDEEVWAPSHPSGATTVFGMALRVRKIIEDAAIPRPNHT